MAESSAKRRKIDDPRFANIQSDPRYRLPGKRQKVKLDKRFSRALKDDDFSRRAKVDRYGRPLESNAERQKLERKYEFEAEGESDNIDDDDEVQAELQRVETKHDPLREGKYGDTSSSESSSDEESDVDVDEDADFAEGEAPAVPLGEVSSRLAVVNLDWDNIRAEDLMAVFSSEAFLGQTGRLLKVSIYPSEFGKERMQREEREGPPKEIFASNRADDADENEEDEDEDEEDDAAIKESILKPDDGADFDSQALRNYQLQRLRYFYAVLTFSSPTAAKSIYDAVDGTEYLSTANFFDLRFVPDDTDFSTDQPREECQSIPAWYKPNDFVTDALQHSKVKLTWDAEDGGRKEAIGRAFRGGRKEIEENDLKAYLGTDSSDDEDEYEADDGGVGNSMSKKEAERQKMRALLGLGPEPVKRSKKDEAPIGGVQVTFAAGLSASNENGKRSVFENSPEPDETTVEKYVRKEKERKQKRKDRMKAAREEHATDDNSTTQKDDVQELVTKGKDDKDEQEEDLGFEDPFFAAPELDKTSANKIRKEERLKKKREREMEEEAEQKQRAELELLMAADDDDREGAGLRHFDMKEIEKREKDAARKKHKPSKKKQQRQQESRSADGRKADVAVVVEDSFKVDTSDPRFARLFDSHEYAIDPTNPKFKGTSGMQSLLEEGRKRKNKDLSEQYSTVAEHKGRGEKGGEDSSSRQRHHGRRKTTESNVEAMELVEKIKKNRNKNKKTKEERRG